MHKILALVLVLFGLSGFAQEIEDRELASNLRAEIKQTIETVFAAPENASLLKIRTLLVEHLKNEEFLEITATPDVTVKFNAKINDATNVYEFERIYFYNKELTDGSRCEESIDLVVSGAISIDPTAKKIRGLKLRKVETRFSRGCPEMGGASVGG